MNKMSNSKTVLAGAVMLALGLLAGWGASRLWSDGSHGGKAGTAAPATSAAERKVLYWYDPMVPSQRFDKPGKSPFMDMQLVPKYADEADAASKPGVAVSPQAQQSLGLRVARAERQPVSSSIDAVGTVMLNERDVSILQSRASGFVERVYARAPGDVVAAGAPIVDVLLPEWLAAQQEFLAVRATGDATLAAASRQRLVLLGMPAELIEQVESSGKPQALQTLAAPIGGVITELMVRQGMTVGMNMTLARINGLATVWVEAAVPELMAAGVAPGQAAEVRLPATPGQVIRGRVAAVLPEANRETRTLRVRVELPNPGQRLRAGMFAQVAIQGAPQGDAVVVPIESVVRTGRRALVYVLDAPGRYRPVEVQLGPELGERIVVRRGLEAGQQVVASGQFLIDSEASLQGITARAAPPAGAASQAAPSPASAPSARTAPTAPAAAEHEVRGTVVEVERMAITLDHEAVPAIKWPRMTMPFQLARPDLAKGLKAGDKVIFRFRQQGDEAVVTAINPAGAAAGASTPMPPMPQSSAGARR
ncbi:MAG: efflux RND transporter periplasmic adaptor subunit [Burkholderiales bacterium]|nr:efflux RND transporter periplasmic adaptor subunit [Burkholderiales bacterium]